MGAVELPRKKEEVFVQLSLSCYDMGEGKQYAKVIPPTLRYEGFTPDMSLEESSIGCKQRSTTQWPYIRSHS
jgi:hypothetical protein